MAGFHPTPSYMLSQNRMYTTAKILPLQRQQIVSSRHQADLTGGLLWKPFLKRCRSARAGDDAALK